MVKYLDRNGLSRMWAKIKATFIKCDKTTGLLDLTDFKKAPCYPEEEDYFVSQIYFNNAGESSLAHKMAIETGTSSQYSGYKGFYFVSPLIARYATGSENPNKLDAIKIGITAATQSAAGSMSAADKKKLDSYPTAFATVNKKSLSGVSLDTVTTDGLYYIVGGNVTGQPSGMAGSDYILKVVNANLYTEPTRQRVMQELCCPVSAKRYVRYFKGQGNGGWTAWTEY